MVLIFVLYPKVLNVKMGDPPSPMSHLRTRHVVLDIKPEPENNILGMIMIIDLFLLVANSYYAGATVELVLK